MASCGSRSVIYPPGQDPVDLSLPELGNEIDRAIGNQNWTEFSRVTSIINIDGIDIERIEQVTFNKPSGTLVTLQFDN